MNDFLRLDEVELWHVAGWTMLHFAWLGAAVMAAALVGRLVVLRRAPAAARYAAAVATLVVLAVLPIVIAARLTGRLPAELAVQPVAVEQAAFEQTTIQQMEMQQFLQVDQVQMPPKGGAVPRLATTERVVEVAGSDEPATLAADPLPLATILAGVEICVPYLPWLWLVGTPATFALLATGLVGTRRLRGASRAIDDGPIAEACARLCRTLGVRGRVVVATCERIAAPVLVGIVRPIILVPPAALTGWSTDEVEMVLLHELAHVRRWDNLVNLLQRVVESLLFFHPAVWWASAWVRREREACCDAIVVGHTHEPHAYAQMLIEFASRLSEPGRPRPRLGTALTSAMAAGPLRSRVRRILGLDDDPMLVSGRSLVVAAGSLLVVAVLALVYLPASSQAETPADGQQVAESEEPTPPSTVAEALEEYRQVLVTYELGFDSVFPKRPWSAPDPKRLARYPAPEAWPDVLGHADTDPDAFRVVRKRIDGDYENVTGPNAYLVPLDWNIGTKQYATLLFLRGVEAGKHVVAHSYTSLACFGTMAGDVVFESYASALVQGDVSGQITANSYFVLVVTGKLTGRITAQSYATIYIMGGMEGRLELDRSKVYLAGRTTKADLARITGTGQVYLEQSDLAPGEHTVGGLTVTVGGKGDGGSANEPAAQSAASQQTAKSGQPMRLQMQMPDGEQVTAESQDGHIRLQVHRPEAGKFPTLQQQKLADLAYERLGLELEPIGPEDVERVKAFGYDGGLKVTGGQAINDMVVRKGSILVGLGVWPTTSLEDVAKILSRDDLAGLNPLKFYVVRQRQSSFGGPGPRPDELVTGRTSVRLDETRRRSSQSRGGGEAAKPQAVGDAGGDTDRSSLRYEGKTFDQWRDAWQTELSPERRTEAVKALAAFGAHGHGKEAAAAILDIVAQYDIWTVIGDNSAMLPLQNACITAFGASSRAGQGEGVVPQPLASEDALPVLLAAVRSDNRRVRMFLTLVLGNLRDAKATDGLLELTHDADQDVRRSALSALPWVNVNDPNMKVVERIREGLREDTPEASWLMDKLMPPTYGGMGGMRQPSAQLYYVPELYPKLFSSNEYVRQSARRLIRHIQPADAPPVVEQLLQVLSSDAGKDKQVEAIRALAAIGPQARKALPAIERLLTEPVNFDDPRVVPAVVAVELIQEDEAAENAMTMVRRLGYQGDVASVVGEEKQTLSQGRGPLGGGGMF